MVQTQLDSREEGMTSPFPPQETEKIWHGSPDPKNVLQLFLYYLIECTGELSCLDQNPSKLQYVCVEQRSLLPTAC